MGHSAEAELLSGRVLKGSGTTAGGMGPRSTCPKQDLVRMRPTRLVVDGVNSGPGSGDSAQNPVALVRRGSGAHRPTPGCREQLWAGSGESTQNPVALKHELAGPTLLAVRDELGRLLALEDNLRPRSLGVSYLPTFPDQLPLFRVVKLATEIISPTVGDRQAALGRAPLAPGQSQARTIPLHSHQTVCPVRPALSNRIYEF